MASQMQELIDNYIGGSRGEWFYLIEVGNHTVEGGYFYRLRDARLHLRVALRSMFLDDTVIKEYLELRART